VLQHSEEEEDAVNRDERQDDSLLGVLGDELEALALDTGLIELLCSQNENTRFQLWSGVNFAARGPQVRSRAVYRLQMSETAAEASACLYAIWLLSPSLEMAGEEACLSTVVSALACGGYGYGEEADPTLLARGCKALWGLAWSDRSSERAGVAGAVEAVLGAMKNLPREVSVQESGCAALWNICVGNTKISNRAAKAGAGALLLSAGALSTGEELGDEGSEGLACAVCGAIWAIGGSTDLDRRHVIDYASAAATIAHILATFPSDSSLARGALGALALLTRDGEAAVALIATKSRRSVIPAAINAGLMDSSAVANGCVALRHLAAFSKTSNGVNVGEDGKALGALLSRILRRHLGSANVVYEACGTVRSLAAKGLLSGAGHGLGGLVVAAMADHRGDSAVQEVGLAALRNVCMEEVERESVCEAGGLEAVVAAMRCHPTSEAVQKEACEALRSLTYMSIHRKAQLTGQGGVGLMMEAMKTHPTSSQVHEAACKSLWNLAVHSTAERVKREIAQDGTETLERAKRQFARRPTVADLAGHLLESVADVRRVHVQWMRVLHIQFNSSFRAKALALLLCVQARGSGPLAGLPEEVCDVICQALGMLGDNEVNSQDREINREIPIASLADDTNRAAPPLETPRLIRGPPATPPAREKPTKNPESNTPPSKGRIVVLLYSRG